MILSRCSTPGIPWRSCALLVIAVLSFGLIVVSTAYAAAGSLDTSFGGDGKVTTELTPGSDWASDVVIQPDGRILVAGGAYWGDKFAILRYNADGTLDKSFSGDGKALVDFTRHMDFANGIALQANGKIVVAGVAFYGSTYGTFALVRLNGNGSLDTSFSGDGKVTTRFTSTGDFATDVLIQPDGKIVAVGRTGMKRGNGKFALARYNSNGSLDTSFSGDGRVMTDFTGYADRANACVYQADGKIVVAGMAGELGDNPKFALARYTGKGTLDTSFSGDGKATTDFTGSQDQAHALVVQADGRIVAAGVAAELRRSSSFALACYRSDGTLDSGFGGDGKVTTDFTAGKDAAFGIALQPDGKVIAAGSAGWSGATSTFALARYDTDGRLDASFSGDGMVRTDLTAKDDFARAVGIQADGGIVSAGESGVGGSQDKVALARYRGR